jgi:uncharacterized membrane protein YuzA (DUF378 family)
VGLQESCSFGGLLWGIVAVLGFDLILFGGLSFFWFVFLKVCFL